MKISISLIKMFIFQWHFLLEVSNDLTKQFCNFFQINTTIICKFFTFGLQWQTSVELGNIPLLTQLGTFAIMHKIEKRLIDNFGKTL